MRTPSPKNRLYSKRFSAGLTLLRLLALLAIIGLLASWALSKLPDSVKHTQPPKVTAAYKDITGILQGLDKYQKAHGYYPTSEQGLLALVVKPQRGPVPEDWKTGGYVSRLPRDPWGNTYQYRVVNDKQVEVYSYGDKSTNEVSAAPLISKTSS